MIGNIMMAEASSNMEGFVFWLFAFIGIAGFVFALIVGRFVSLWFQAFVSGAPISLFNIVGMSLRKIERGI